MSLTRRLGSLFSLRGYLIHIDPNIITIRVNLQLKKKSHRYRVKIG